MMTIDLFNLKKLAAAVAAVPQGSAAWDKATDALFKKFNADGLVALIEQLEDTQRELLKVRTITYPPRKKIDPYCYDQGGNNKAYGFNEAIDEIRSMNVGNYPFSIRRGEQL